MLRACSLVLLLLGNGLMWAQESRGFYADPGPLAVESFSAEWRDAKRDREVPVRIYYPKNAQGPVPVIIWSHGLGGSREGYAAYGKFWGSHGYVVVHPQHKGSDGGVIREGGMNALRSAGNAQNAIARPKDITFVIDQLVELNKTHPKLKGLLNLDAIGVGGHSFGAQTTLLIGGQTLGPAMSYADTRVKALMPMSAPVPVPALRNKAYTGVHLPILHMTGTKDDSPIGETKAAERRIPFDTITGCDQWFINFQEGDHMIFSGRMARLSDEQKKQDTVFLNQIKQCSLAFWNAHLKKDEQAKDWLNKDMIKYLGSSAASVEQKK